MNSKQAPKPRSSMAKFIAVKIDASGKTQADIASECEFTRPNVVSMIKLGRMRLPLGQLAAFAKAINVDVYDLFCWWMRDYYGKTWLDLEHYVVRAHAGFSTNVRAAPSHPPKVPRSGRAA